MKKFKIIILSILLTLFPLNFLIAETEQSFTDQYVEYLEKEKTFQCTVDNLENRGTALSFYCNGNFKGQPIEYLIYFYQVDSYDGVFFKENRSNKEIKELLQKNYDIHSNMNINSIDRSAIDKQSSHYVQVIGTVYLDGIDVSLTLINLGFFWASPPKWEVNKEYEQAQLVAKESKVGFWKDNNLISPWELKSEYLKVAEKVEIEKKIIRTKKYEAEMKSRTIGLWFILFAAPLGLICLIYGIIKARSGIAIFTLLIPYVAIGGNAFLVSLSLFNPNAAYFLYGIFITPLVAIGSILLGLVLVIIKSFFDRNDEYKEHRE